MEVPNRFSLFVEERIPVVQNAGDYLTALIIFLGAFSLLYLIQKTVLGRFQALAKRTDTDVDDTLVRIADSVKPPLVTFLAFYIAVRSIELPDIAEVVLNALVIVAIT